MLQYRAEKYAVGAASRTFRDIESEERSSD